MDRYEFTATTAKSDILIGLFFSMLLMFPILGIQLGIFYLKLNDFLQSQPIFLYLIVVLVFGTSLLLIKKTTKESSEEFCRRIIWKKYWDLV